MKNVFHKLQRRNENMACDQSCSSVKSDVIQDDFTKEGECIRNVVWCMHFLTYCLYLHSVLIFFIGVDWNMNNKLANTESWSVFGIEYLLFTLIYSIKLICNC